MALVRDDIITLQLASLCMIGPINYQALASYFFSKGRFYSSYTEASY